MVPTMTNTGINIYPYLIICSFSFGNCDFGNPKIPNRFASKWVPIKIPVKYNTAGIAAASMMVEYATPKYSIIINAAAPITGGMICPPVDADASVPAANSGVNPDFFIIGMVNEPEATVFPTELPEIDHLKAHATTAALAVPPVNKTVKANAKSFKNYPMPVCIKITPKNKNRKMNFEEICIGVPNTPLS